MDPALCERLCCPRCGGELAWAIAERDGHRLHRAEATCPGCGARYPVRDGVGSFVVEGAEDPWEKAESGLARHLADNPDVERALLHEPVETLGPADAMFRALVLEERGAYYAAQPASDRAYRGLYTDAFRHCAERELQHVVEEVSALDGDGPVVDVASGRCTLVERLARSGTDVVATDVSPVVLDQSRRRLAGAGLAGATSFLAFDARRTPFKDGAAGVLTSHLGLANVADAGTLLVELRRIAGRLLATTQFYPENDETNRAALREHGFETLLVRPLAVAAFEAAGWRVQATSTCLADARPTPAGVVVEGARVDALPVAPTVLEWCVVDAVASG